MGKFIGNCPVTLYFTPWLRPLFMSRLFKNIFVPAAVIGCGCLQYLIDDGLRIATLISLPMQTMTFTA